MAYKILGINFVVVSYHRRFSSIRREDNHMVNDSIVVAYVYLAVTQVFFLTPIGPSYDTVGAYDVVVS